ncbi:hypothetical protein ONV75_18715 [Clostridium sp. LQ25]|uniref:hypothetical protein n=1 Tax=Clostridium TaxID=1485 RepID=UPI0005EB29D8|nr:MULTISPECIES: hypothetical protein [Clostridium]APF20972.1 hypothetical protein NPD4_4046 [Clostridium butyricum]QUF85238.1 hypothetical protein KDJ93_19450 [Clostridium butyricum]UZT08636.1 hypothetical protein ONV75_18715 [Clostridium sp. LQ25]
MSRYDVVSIMKDMTDSLRKNINYTIENNPQSLSEMIIYLDLLDSWVVETNELEANIVLKEVCYDLLTSLFIVSNGMYRNGYISLRSALELGLSFIYFVDNNYDFLLWQKNEYDMKWATLKNYENGVVSKKYLALFNNQVDLEVLINITENTYRECSEYVHGKYEYMHTKINEQNIIYNKENFEVWSQMFLMVVKILIVFIGIRFNNKIEKLEEDKKIVMDEIIREFKLAKVGVYSE